MRFATIVMLSVMCVASGWSAVDITMDAPITASDLGFHKASISVGVGADQVVITTMRISEGGKETLQRQVSCTEKGSVSQQVLVLNDGLWNNGKATRFKVKTPLGVHDIDLAADKTWGFSQIGSAVTFFVGESTVSVTFEVESYAKAKAAAPELPAKSGEWVFNLPRTWTGM